MKFKITSGKSIYQTLNIGIVLHGMKVSLKI